MIRPGDILQVAAGLVSTKRPTEADCRSAISRAYYSVFHHAVDRLGIDLGKGAGPLDQREQDELFAQPPVCPPDIKAAKLMFPSLKPDRERADYDLAASMTLLQAQAAVARAGQIIGA